jgi:hypothetical protein
MASPTLTFDKNGQCIRVGPWGSKTKGHKHEFSMNKGNYVNFISGTHDNHGVTLLKFVSTKDVYGPFGYLIGQPFSVPLQENHALVSFFGYSGGQNLVGFGAYIVSQDD